MKLILNLITMLVSVVAFVAGVYSLMTDNHVYLIITNPLFFLVWTVRFTVGENKNYYVTFLLAIAFIIVTLGSFSRLFR